MKIVFYRDMISAYDAISIGESFKIKEVRDYSHELTDRITCISDLKMGKLQSLRYPIVAVMNRLELRKLTALKKDFDEVVQESVMRFDDGNTAELQDALEMAATFGKPRFVAKYVKSKRNSGIMAHR